MRARVRIIAAWLLLCGMLVASGRATESIRIDVPTRASPVDFTKDVAPLLQANCVACHNLKKAEGGLNLETVPAIFRGGDQGPAVVPRKSDESLLLSAAAHRQDLVMPPPDNIVGAKPLTPAELGLVKLWIDQGAIGPSESSRAIQWQSPPSSYQPAFAAAVTPDSQHAVCSRGRQLYVYHLPTGKLVARLVDPALGDAAAGNAHHDIVRSLAFDPAGELLASGAFREVKLWRRPRVTQAAQWKLDAPGRALAVSADGRRVATGDEKGRIQIWQAGNGKPTQSIAAHDTAVTGLVFAGDTLFSYSADKSLKAWKLDGTALASTELPEAATSLAAIDEGRQLISGDARGIVFVWDAASLAKPLAEIKAHGAAVTALSAAEKPREFYSGGADGLMRGWDVTSGNKLSEFKNDAPVVSIAAAGQRIVAAGAESVTIWDESGKLIVKIGDPRLAARLAKIDSDIVFTKAVINRTENDLKSYEGLIRITGVTKDAVKAAEDELVKAQKARDEKKTALEKLTAEGEKADKTKVEAATKALATAETAALVAVTVIDRAKAVYERTAQRLADAQAGLAANKELLQKQETARTEAAATLKAGGMKIRSLAFSLDGRSLAIGCEDGSVQLVDPASGALVQSLDAHQAAVSGLRFAKDMLVTASADQMVSTWHAPSEWRLERVIGGLDHSEVLVDRVLSVGFSHDGRWLATGGGMPSRSGEVKIFNVADGKLVREFAGAHSETVFAVRFSPLDNRLATAGGDRLIKVFDAQSGSELRNFAGHTGHVLGLGWKADGKLLISSGANNVLKLWDPETGLPVRTMKGGQFGNRTYKGPITGVTFIGDSEEILAVSGDGTVRLQRDCSDHEIMTFAGSTGYQFAAAATPDGKAVIACDSAGVLRVWSGHQPQPRLTLSP